MTDSKDNSPVRGILKVLSKPRSSRDDTVSGEGNHSSKGSLETFSDKLKARLGVNDDDDSTGDNKLTKLLAKRKTKKPRDGQSGAGGEVVDGQRRGRGADGGRSTNAASNESRSTLDDNDDGSSLMTSDSEDEALLKRPPPLMNHDSHIGYLTSSSPKIQATTVSDLPAPSTPSNPLDGAPQLAYPAGSANPALRHAWTINAGESGSSLSIDESGKTRSRSVSPGARIKDAFKPLSKKNNTPKDEAKRIEMPSSPVAQAPNGGTLSNKPSLSSIVTDPDSPQAKSPRTPMTTITPPTPVEVGLGGARSVPRTSEPPSIRKHPGAPSVPSGSTMSHRRSRSDSIGRNPSKLSQSMHPPLTPTIEEPRVPGSRSGSGATTASGGGFFSSVFSAAQNAATTLTNSINNNSNRPRSATLSTAEEESTPRLPTTDSIAEEDTAVQPARALAIDTIGTGDLSLSHLGIKLDSPSSVASPDGGRSRSGTMVHNAEAAARAEDSAAARAVSMAYAGRAADDMSVSTPIVEDAASRRPVSADGSSLEGARTPPNGSVYEGETSRLLPSGSIREIMDKKRRKHRNSSTTTVGAVNAASPGRAEPKVTGVAVANQKRNKDFHQLFRSVPEDEYLVEDYSCALQRDIILAGRIYVSEGHICFSSNILGWVTTLVISFDEVVSIEKESTAMVFPNAIAIQTLHARHTFRSLLSREATYDLIIGIWKISHPALQSTENGTKLVEGANGAKSDQGDSGESDDENGSDGSDQDMYDEDEDVDGADEQESVAGVAAGSVAGSEPAEPSKSAVARKVSTLGAEAGAAAGGAPNLGGAKAADKASGAAAAAASDIPGPASHVPTECSDQASHYDKPLKDEVIQAPLGKIYSMMFGPASGGFMSRWLMDEVKVWELQMDEKARSLDENNKSRNYSYIKPLGGAIGPKQTKCVITENLDAFDLERAVSVTVSTQTPDVPSGNVFTTKTRYCLMWGPNNGTRLIINFTIEWSGKSWLKGPIEKGAADGQATYASDLVKALRAGVSSRPRASSKVKKGKRRRGEGENIRSSTSSPAAGGKSTQADNWGLFEPLHGIFGPVVDLIRPLFSSYSLIGLLLVLLIVSMYRNNQLHTSGHHQLAPDPSTPERIAAYEEIWRGEEAALWEWLEERVGIQDGMAYPAETGKGNADTGKEARKVRQRVLKGEGDTKLRDMGQREVEHAIEVTEEKLRTLKEVVQRKRTDAEADIQPEPL